LLHLHIAHGDPFEILQAFRASWTRLSSWTSSFSWVGAFGWQETTSYSKAYNLTFNLFVKDSKQNLL
jgi:hypothetical protein